MKTEDRPRLTAEILAEQARKQAVLDAEAQARQQAILAAAEAPIRLPEASQADDPVNHPSHYTRGGIECIDALSAMVSAFPNPGEAALAWQVVKYVWRFPFKENPLQDLQKARFYLDRLIRGREQA